MEIRLCGEGRIERGDLRWNTVIVKRVDTLVHSLNVRVVVVAPFESKLEIMSAVEPALVPGGARSNF